MQKDKYTIMAQEAYRELYIVELICDVVSFMEFDFFNFNV